LIYKKFLEYTVINQKKILVLFATVVVSFLVFLLIIYLPKRKAIKNLKMEYAAIEKEIKDIERLTGQDTLDASMTMLSKKLDEMEKKLPSSEEATLKEISNLAETAGISVSSLMPQDIKRCPIQGDVPGYECMVLANKIHFTCTFKGLGKYLGKMQNEFPTILRIKKLTLKKVRRGDIKNPALVAMLETSMYMLHLKE